MPASRSSLLVRRHGGLLRRQGAQTQRTMNGVLRWASRPPTTGSQSGCSSEPNMPSPGSRLMFCRGIPIGPTSRRCSKSSSRFSPTAAKVLLLLLSNDPTALSVALADNGERVHRMRCVPFRKMPVDRFAPLRGKFDICLLELPETDLRIRGRTNRPYCAADENWRSDCRLSATNHRLIEREVNSALLMAIAQGSSRSDPFRGRSDRRSIRAGECSATVGAPRNGGVCGKLMSFGPLIGRPDFDARRRLVARRCHSLATWMLYVQHVDTTASSVATIQVLSCD